MRLLILVSVFTLAIPATTFAQKTEAPAPPRWTISPRHGPASEGWPRDPIPRFTIPPRGTVDVPLPQIGLPLPKHGLSPEQSYEHRVGRGGFGRRHRRPPITHFPGVVYVAPDYFAAYNEPVPIPAPVVDQPMRTGRLVLDPQPGSAQVFVDGYYAGVSEDFSAERGGGVLEAGEHRIDITAPGYEPLSVLLRLAPEQTITYRGVVKEIPLPAPKTAPTTFYLIPGCYMGNIPPKDARLPASCDLGRVVEFKY